MLDALKKTGLQYVLKNIFPALYGKKGFIKINAKVFHRKVKFQYAG
jgi:hypothetical protein